MGGKAITTVPTVRLESSTYHSFARDILTTLSAAFPDGDFRAIPAYRQKPDFGDLDILYAFSDPVSYQHFSESVDQILKAAERVKGGDVISLGVPLNADAYFQVDLIKSSPTHIDFTEFYFSYNDLGNLMGMVARFAGFKLSHEGLYYIYRPSDKRSHVFRELLVTRDTNETLSLLGFSPEDYHPDAFDALNDIFRFVLSSRYMARDIFLGEHKNHTARRREQRRGTYSAFVEHVRTLPESDAAFKMTYEDRHALRGQIHDTLMNNPDFTQKYRQMAHDYETLQAFKAKYGSDKVSRITGLQGKPLGRFMGSFMGGRSKEAFRDWVLEKTDDELDDAIREHWKDYQ